MTIHLTVRTNQEAYDTVKAHLSAMPRRAMDAQGNCAYCTDDGQRCAVGALLDCSDNEARELPVFDEVRMMRHLIDFGDVYVGLLNDLQVVHDEYHNWRDGFVGHDELRRVARKWGLTP